MKSAGLCSTRFVDPFLALCQPVGSAKGHPAMNGVIEPGVP